MIRFFKYSVIFTLLACGGAISVLVLFLLQDAPLLDVAEVPTPQDVLAARQLLRDVRAAASDDPDKDAVLLATVEQLNSAIRLVSRMIDGFRGRVYIKTGSVQGEVSIPVAWLGSEKWLNISARVPAFGGQVGLKDLTVGSTPVSGPLALNVARIAANVSVGEQFGNKVIQSVTEMTVTAEQLRFRLAIDEVGKNGVMRGAVSQLRGAEMPSQQQVEIYHVMIRTAMADGRLPQTGSFLPYLQFTLAAAQERSTAQTAANVYTAAIFGLAKVCGARDFSMIVGRLAFDDTVTQQTWNTTCSELTFNDRIDSRRHFVTAAALQAASNNGVAISIGEFKELYDSISGAGGFDFTDMAANLSGIRLSDAFVQAPLENWPAFLARLQAESDVIVSFDGIPHIMTKEVFKDRYSDVNSAAYHAQIADIDARIDQLELYQTD